tara:strand:- start:321 stop:440 length:120 start_codon:yes stop_codon:yes gene_type:complete
MTVLINENPVIKDSFALSRFVKTDFLLLLSAQASPFGIG